LSNVDFCTIILQPDFVVNDIKVKNSAIDPPFVFPTHIDDLVMISLQVKVTLRVDRGC
jgi:hypothetical protein